MESRERPPMMRLRMYPGTEEALQKLMRSTGQTATQLLNEMILYAAYGKESINEGSSSPRG